MMRAVRFASQLDFQIESETLQGIARHSRLLEKIAVERCHSEFVKMMLGVAAQNGLNVMLDTGLDRHVPVLGEHEQALKQLANSPLNLQNEVQVWSLLAFKFGFSRGQISSCVKKWKTANKIINDVILTTELLFAIKKQQVTNWLLYQTGAANITNAIDVFGHLSETQTLMSRYAGLPIKTKKQLQITGGQLIQQRVLQPGPELGKILDYLERAVVDGQISNNFDDLKAAAVNFLNED